MRFVFIVCLLFSCSGTLLKASAEDTAFTPREHFGALHEREATVIHGAGQSREIELANYVAAVGPEVHPCMYNTYTAANRSPERMREQVAEWEAILQRYPEGMMLQIGLSMKDHEQEIIDGKHDEAIVALTNALNETGRRIFVRIGYEANGFWNEYRPETYTPAFQRIARIFHDQSDSIAVVWCIVPIDAHKIPHFYPGQGTYENPDPACDIIDWWSIDLFERRFIDSSHGQYSRTTGYLDKALEAKKPVMIGESTAQGVGTGNGRKSWDNWFAHYFRLIREHPSIKAFIYINRNWIPYVTQGWSDWGDCRIQNDPVVTELLQEELRSPLYLHAKASRPAVRVIQPSQALINTPSVRATEVTTEADTEDQGNDAKLITIAGKNTEISSCTILKFPLTSIKRISHAELFMFGKSNQKEDIRIHLEIGEREIPLTVNDNEREEWTSVSLTESTQKALTSSNEPVLTVTLDNPVPTNATATFHSDSGEMPPQLIVYGEFAD